MITEPKVWAFFYGSYTNFEVLGEVELTPQEWELGRLNGYDIHGAMIWFATALA